MNDFSTLTVFLDQAWEELSDAKKYIREAIDWRDSDREYASKYMEMAKEEMGHYRMISEMANRYLASEDDESLKCVWKWQLSNLTTKLAEIEAMITVYEK